MSDNDTKISDLKMIASQFIHERDWRQFHGAKNMSMNIAAEAAELMELFTWTKDKQSSDHIVNEKREAVEHELADVLFSVLAFADEYAIDLSAALQNKMKLNAQKYPVEKSKGVNKKYTEY